MTRPFVYDPLKGVIDGSARDDAAWAGIDLEGKLMHARALETALNAVGRILSHPLRKALATVEAWNTRRRDHEILAGMDTVFRADLGHYRLHLRRPANNDSSAERVA